MEGLTPYIAILKNLRNQARELTSHSLSLANLFAKEASRLKRGDEASRLKALHSYIRQQMDRVKSSENAAHYGDSKAGLIVSLGGLAVGGTIRMVSKNKQLQAFSGHLLNSLAGKQHPFGMVLVCIGPKGIPDDVEVVSISHLARESDRGESEVIDEMQKGGFLLFSEKAFSLLIEKLVHDVQEGRLLLPISTERLSQIKPSSGP